LDQKRINVDIKRSLGIAEGVKSRFEVFLEEGMSVLNVLEFIAKDLDPTLTFYSSCRIGKCTGCTMRINGHRSLACMTLVDGDLSLEPDERYPVIRDLVVDMGEL
jgi:fumarate reductase iron-sulfur subunit